MLWGLLPWLRGDRRPSSSNGRTRAAILLMLRAQAQPIYVRGRRPLAHSAALTKQRLGRAAEPKEETRPRIVRATLPVLLRVLNVNAFLGLVSLSKPGN